MNKLPISVVVLTKNEAKDIEECLDKLLAFSDDVHVLDSGSTDATVSIARQKNVPVYANEFTGFGDQRNWAIDNIPHRYTWALHFDADERPTEAFIDELGLIVTDPNAYSGYYVANKLMLGDRWLRYSSGYPVYQARLFQLGQMRFMNLGHGQREVSCGKLGYMRQPYLHYGFSKGLKNWFEKHAGYAHAEAVLARSERLEVKDVVSKIFFGSRVDRRRALKQVFRSVPGRATVRFWELLLLRGGILDGKAGINYARMMAAYELMVTVQATVEGPGKG